MGWQWTPYAVALVTTGVITSGLTSVGWRHRSATAGREFTLLLAAITGWVWAYLLQMLRTDVLGKVLFGRLSLSFVPLTILAMFLFAVTFTQQQSTMTRRKLALLSVEPTLFVLALWTNGAHHLMRSATSLTTVRPPTMLGVVFEPFVIGTVTLKPLFWAHVGYSYLLTVAASYLLLRMVIRSRHVYQRQAAALVIAALVPLVANVATLFGMNPFPGLDLTPFSFAITGIALSWAVISPQLLDLEPIAREMVIDEMHECVVVLDMEDRIVDINPTAQERLGIEGDEVIGNPVQTTLPGDPGRFERFDAQETVREEVTIRVGDGVHYFDVRVSPLYDHQNQRCGRLVLAHDITDRKQYEQALEQQNEQLDQFASVVSHDLRNPLNVAYGSLELLERDREGDEHIENVRESLDRMDRIIGDVLTLAREGQRVSETIPTDLRTLAEDAWENVESHEADLVVDVDMEVSADRSRLRQTFENLFRNALEHGGTDVTIRIGETDGGFFVADDGPGIPDDIRDDVFEYGYTGHEGTGFGLAIVRSIVEAHGWEITATESSDGGARFEITGLAQPRSDTAGQEASVVGPRVSDTESRVGPIHEQDS